MLIDHALLILGLIATALHITGIAMSVHAVMRARTAAGATAWAISLVTFPYLAVPLYAVLGTRKFTGYVQARRKGDVRLNHIAEALRGRSKEVVHIPEKDRHDLHVMASLAKMPFTRGNSGQVLIGGEATFKAIFEGIESARRYILVQFYIVKDDALGREFKEKLIRRAGEGIKVRFLYDKIGSHALPAGFVTQMRDAGIDVSLFRSSKRRTNRFQINFRNHRKIVVVDGETAYVGGLNVGDEYMGRDPKFGSWRDTHCKVTGPAAVALQLSFLEDWHWAMGEIPELDWNLERMAEEDMKVLIVPTGPSDELETCSLFFVQAINSAKRRLWITSPYFVPDPQVMVALQLAALRGVDVRILLPERPDHLLVYLSSFYFIREAGASGVKFFRYQPGFLHQKVLLVDEEIACIGTANLDNRSFRINFEITALFWDRRMASEVEAMLEKDFSDSREAVAGDLDRRPFWFRLAVGVSRLMAPIQ